MSEGLAHPLVELIRDLRSGEFVTYELDERASMLGVDVIFSSNIFVGKDAGQMADKHQTIASQKAVSSNMWEGVEEEFNRFMNTIAEPDEIID